MSSRWKRRMKRALQNANASIEDKRILICSPMQDMCHTAFCMSLVNLFAYTAVNSPPTLAIGMLQHGCSILQFSREALAKKALQQNATHILWIDSDMEFPPDTLLRLAAHNVDIVGANCVSRRPPFAFTARYEGGHEVPTTTESSGLEKVARAGTGILLVSAEVYRAVPEPWFDFTWIPESNYEVITGEDVRFCRLASQAGFEVFVDHDLSKKVNHVGTFGYNPLLRAATQENVND